MIHIYRYPAVSRNYPVLTFEPWRARHKTEGVSPMKAGPFCF